MSPDALSYAHLTWQPGDEHFSKIPGDFKSTEAARPMGGAQFLCLRDGECAPVSFAARVSWRR